MRQDTRRRLILITGIPGTGKTFMGDYLRDNHGFQHVNREHHQPREFTQHPRGFLTANDGNIVATWGFRPVPDYNGVIELRGLGFFVVWFDGPRDVALRHFNRRGTVSEKMFLLQMFKVMESGVVDALNAPQINPFEVDGEFRSPKSIAQEILDLEQQSH